MKCHFCDKLFKGREFLEKHITRKHDKNNEAINPARTLTNNEYLNQLLGEL